MLRHDDAPETSTTPEARTTPAAQVRVTPQELAAALARLEARQGGLDGTIPLGDAVQELGLNVTPDELLREIEAGRALPQEGKAGTRQALSNRLRISIAVALSLVLSGGALLASLRMDEPAKPAVAVITAPAAPQAAPLALPNNLLVRVRDGKMVLLSEVPDGQPVLCDLAAVDEGVKMTDFAPGVAHWNLIKHHGRVYLRGWIGDMSDAALRSTIVTVHPSVSFVPTGLHPVPVTLPLSGFRLPPSLSNDTLINADHIVPDGHLKEKW